MNSKKQFRNIAKTVLALLFFAGTISVFAQNNEYNKLEKMQDQNEIYLMEVYDVIKDYPNTTYEYVYHDGHLHEVIVRGIDDISAKRQVEAMIYKMRNNKDHMENMCNRVGVYYVPEKEAEPEKGLDKFREKISENLTYPDEASSIGVEGTVFVKFVVDENGEIRNLTTAENIESPYEQEVAMLEEAAIEAVEETDMDWTPAVSSGRLVESYVVVPITFDFRKDPSVPVLIR
jgi:TonB family protein